MDLTMYRNKQGFIDLDKLKTEPLGQDPECTSLSEWLLLPDDCEYLFKWSNNPNFYELYSSLVEYKAAKSLEIQAIEYDLAIYNGKPGIISKKFLGEDEELIYGAEILSFVNKTSQKKYRNNVKDVYEAFVLYFKDSKTVDDMMRHFILDRYLFDMILGEEDGFPHNWGAIRNKKTNEYRWANRYGADQIARIYEGEEYIKSKIKENTLPNGSLDIENIKDEVDWIHCSISYDSKRGPVSEDFRNFCEENLELAKEIFYGTFINFDIFKIFEDVEKSIGIDLPEEYKLWASTIVNIRIKMIRVIIEDLENTKTQIPVRL